MSNNEIIIKPIVYGSIALFLGKKKEEKISHKWCVYVRGINNEDISNFIKEVTFTLHNSFYNQIRVVSKPPFEVYEVGWGEFDIKIQIHLIDESIKPIEVIHGLKLYPSQPNIAPSTKKPVVSENYDEIIFVNPKKALRAALYRSNANEMDVDMEDINRKDDVLEKDTVNDESKIDNGDNDQIAVDNDKESSLNNSNTNLNPNSYIPNIKNYFQRIDDSSNLKQLEEENIFITKEIQALKESLSLKEKDIAEIKKRIKEIR